MDSKKDIPDKDEELLKLIKTGYTKSHGTYGYRRVHIWLKKECGIQVNQKRVHRIMAESGLQSISRRKYKYKKYSDEMHRYKNILNRNFNAQAPNHKWVTDITYIPTCQGMLYLSVIKDLFDNSIISHQTASNLGISIVMKTIEKAMKKEKVTNELILHSDQGYQYTSHAYYNLTKYYNIIPSMSRRGNCLDNACCENFFGHLKEECTRHYRFQTLNEAKKIIEEYIDFYNKERIQLKNELTPYEKRYKFTS